MNEQKRRVALVTGASSGFGLHATVELARAGFCAVGTLRDLARRERLDAAAREAGAAVAVERLDVTDAASIAACVEKVEREHGPIEVLVNNAGFGLGGTVEDTSLDELRSVFETNFFGLVAVTKAVLPLLRERRLGRIVNVSSIAGRVAVPGLSAYVASKFAVEGHSDALRLEARPFGIEVVLIEPGSYRTDIFERNRRVAKRALEPSSPYAERYRRFQKVVDRSIARAGDPREVALAIVRAATARKPRARYVLGRDAKLELFVRRLLPLRTFENILISETGFGEG